VTISPLFFGGFWNGPGPIGMCGGVCCETEPFTAPGRPMTFTVSATLSLMIDVHVARSGADNLIGLLRARLAHVHYLAGSLVAPERHAMYRS
jgi:hypothetical protein